MKSPTSSKSARDLSAGDLLEGMDFPVKSTAYANGTDGRDPHMVGGPGLSTAYAVRVIFADDSERLFHPGRMIPLRTG